MKPLFDRITSVVLAGIPPHGNGERRIVRNLGNRLENGTLRTAINYNDYEDSRASKPHTDYQVKPMRPSLLDRLLDVRYAGVNRGAVRAGNYL